MTGPNGLPLSESTPGLVPPREPLKALAGNAELREPIPDRSLNAASVSSSAQFWRLSGAASFWAQQSRLFSQALEPKPPVKLASPSLQYLVAVPTDLRRMPFS
jgi:hypothetical protein